MEASVDVADTKERSLRPLRVMAAVGGVVALAAVVVAFSVGFVVGVVVLAVAPSIPLGLVVATDSLRSG